jgi:hypothetical protein
MTYYIYGKIWSPPAIMTGNDGNVHLVDPPRPSIQADGGRAMHHFKKLIVEANASADVC